MKYRNTVSSAEPQQTGSVWIRVLEFQLNSRFFGLLEKVSRF